MALNDQLVHLKIQALRFGPGINLSAKVLELWRMPVMRIMFQDQCPMIRHEAIWQTI
jgi:hypothetical protein